MPFFPLQESAFGKGSAKDRTYSQQCLLAATGRLAKLRKKQQQALEANGEALVKFADAHNALAASDAHQLRTFKLKKPKTGWAASVVLRLWERKKLRRNKLTPSEMIRIAFDKRHNRHALADMYKVSRQSIVRCLVLTSLTFMEVQLKLLTEFLEWAKAAKPDIATVSLMWDETSQTLALPAVHGSGAHQQRSSWQVLVARLHFCIGFIGGPGKSNLKLYRECVLAPVPLPTNSSAAISSGLRSHPMNKQIMSIVEELLECSRLRFVLHEADAHLANEKLHYHQYHQHKQRAEGQRPIFAEWVKCGNHQVHLVMCDAVEQCPKAADSGGRLLQNLFCASLWLRMGGHFLRLLVSVQQLVQEETFLRWVPNPTPEDRARGHAFRQELCSYLQDNLRHHERQMAANPAQGR